MTQNGKTIFADELRFVLLDISRYITVDEIAQDVLHCFVTYLLDFWPSLKVFQSFQIEKNERGSKCLHIWNYYHTT